MVLGSRPSRTSLCALCGPSAPLRDQALELLQEGDAPRTGASELSRLVPQDGFVLSVSVGRREPLEHTILRGLAHGVGKFWSGRPGRNPRSVKRVLELWASVEAWGELQRSEVPELVSEVARASGTGVLIIVDELGRALEHAARSGSAADLYLLQQLAELPETSGQPPVLILGLLHQAFSEYGNLLASRMRSEWEKVQGRFEDVAFTGSPEQILRLMSAAIDADPPGDIAAAIRSDAEKWFDLHVSKLDQPYFSETMPADRIASLYPLHPAAALALPALCTRYGQNERSAFTFLASFEAHALTSFLDERAITPENRPSYKRPRCIRLFPRSRGSQRNQPNTIPRAGQKSNPR